MLLSEIMVEVGRNLNRTSAEVSAQSIPLVNAWMREWNTRWPYADYLETSTTSAMTASTGQYTLSSDVDKLIDVWVPTLGYKLNRLTEEQLRALSPSAVYGNPIAFSQFGQFGLNFFPIPSSAYGFNFSYYQGLTSVNSTDTLSVQTPVISTKYHDAGVWYVTWRMALRMGDNDLVAFAKAEYDRQFEYAKEDMIVRVAGLHRINFAEEQFINTTVLTDKATEMFYN